MLVQPPTMGPEAPGDPSRLQALLARDLRIEGIMSELVAGQCAVPAQSLAVLVCAAAQVGLVDTAQQLAAAAGAATQQEVFFAGLVDWVQAGFAQDHHAPRWEDGGGSTKVNGQGAETHAVAAVPAAAGQFCGSYDSMLEHDNAATPAAETLADVTAQVRVAKAGEQLHMRGCSSDGNDIGATNTSRKRTAAEEIRSVAVGAPTLAGRRLLSKTGVKRQKVTAPAASCVAPQTKKKLGSTYTQALSLHALASVREIFPQHYRVNGSESDEAATDTDDPEVQPSGSFLEAVYSSDEDEIDTVKPGLPRAQSFSIETSAGIEQPQSSGSPCQLPRSQVEYSSESSPPAELSTEALDWLSRSDLTARLHVQSKETAAATQVLALVSSPEFDDSAIMRLSKLGREQLARQQQQHTLLQKVSSSAGKGLDVTDAFFQMELCS